MTHSIVAKKQQKYLLMAMIGFNKLSFILFFLSLNIYIELITSHLLLQIPPIKKTLQEYRKKMWHDYHHKLLAQCMDGLSIKKSRNILSVTEVLERLYQCLVTQHREVYKAPQRIKKFKIYDLKSIFLKKGVVNTKGDVRIP